MILYIPLEISVRELAGHLLLAAVATSRGHQVVIASSTDLWLYKRLNMLPAGCFMVKNVNISAASQKMYEEFIAGGFDIYCQDQEPAILWGDFAKYIGDYNIKCDQFLPFKGVFCWGERDTSGYASFFGSRGGVFFNTGSPRADLWHPRFAPALAPRSVEQLKPYILVVSNFGLLLGKRHWSEWLITGRENEVLESQHQENNFLMFLAEDFSVATSIISATNHLAAKFKDYRIVVRPHPLDYQGYWRNIFSRFSNVHIADNLSSLSQWIAGASAVVQNGCTSALETVLQKIPLISYGPDRTHGDLAIPNKLGARARNTAELDLALDAIFNGTYMHTHQQQSEEILRPLISTDHGDAALRMIRIMEGRSAFNSNMRISDAHLVRMRLMRTAKNLMDGFRRGVMNKSLGRAAYQFDRHAIREQMEAIAGVLRIQPPKVDFVSKQGVVIG